MQAWFIIIINIIIIIIITITNTIYHSTIIIIIIIIIIPTIFILFLDSPWWNPVAGDADVRPAVANIISRADRAPVEAGPHAGVDVGEP